MEAYMKAGAPGEAHKALAQAVGTYDCKVKSWHAPGAPPTEDSGTATRKMALDGRVLIEDFSTSMMGMPFKGQGMHGYDNVTGKHWSTWVDSMSTGVMLSEGTCDAQGACTFTGTYNDAIKKAPATLRMTSRWTSPKIAGLRDVRPRPRRQGNEDDGDHLQQEGVGITAGPGADRARRAASSRRT